MIYILALSQMLIWSEPKFTVNQLIEFYAEDVVTAKRVADCESKTGLYRNNWQGSSAEGLFMFMPSTFNAYCSGDIKNDIDQIKCFNKLYKIHHSWWKCQ